ncbi:phage tail protein [Roseospira marina]|uniref:Phage tail protein n=2 Tax=Roseospira marina TaxID=140057 RepID=A0A5M6IHN4_9PROT|nr:phage tail protein [Roseospira marina]
MALGEFRFAVGTAAFDRLRRVRSYTWATQDRFGRLPAAQFTGPALPTLDLEGTLFPGFGGGLSQIDAMADMAAAGEPLDLVDGTGGVHGLWVLLEVGDTRTVFLDNGAARRIDFQARLQMYGEDAA